MTELLSRAELPRPRIDIAGARVLLATHFDIADAEVSELGSQQDRNFLVSTSDRRMVLKVANSSWKPTELAAQDACQALLAAGWSGRPDIQVPTAIAKPTTTVIDGAEHGVRLLTYVEGEPLAEWNYLAPKVVGDLGRLAAAMTAELAPMEHPGLERWLQWDLRCARDVVAELVPRVLDRELRARILDATNRACDRLDALAALLPIQPIHGDLTDDNVVAEVGQDGRPKLTGIIDFGDLGYGWRVAELAVSCASVLPHADATPVSVLPAVRAFHEDAPLSEHELAAFWPMVVARCAVLVVSGLSQLAIDPENAYAANGSAKELAMFEVACSVPAEVMHQVLRAELAFAPSSPPVIDAAHPLLSADLHVLDLSVTSPLLDSGPWLRDGVEGLVAAEVLAGSGPACTAVAFRHGEARLTRAPALSREAPETVAIGVEVIAAAAVTITAPWDGTVRALPSTSGAGSPSGSGSESVLVLDGPEARLVLHGVTPVAPDSSNPLDGVPADVSARAGETVALLPAGASLHVQLVTEPDLIPPRFTTPALAAGWLAICPDPSELLGLRAGGAAAPAVRSAGELMAQRDAVIADAQEFYYGSEAPQFERGWREFMIDTGARAYVDTVNNVTMVGHGDPRIAAAAARQWLLLNTNSRFHYAAIVDYSARLAALLPPPLDTVFLVNSGSEAVDLALRLAKVHTGRADIVAVEEAYHGWTDASDAVSTSLHDNPQAAGTRPEWVHSVLAPNTLRGVHRGPDAAALYADDVTSSIHALAARGHAAAAFICEPVNGKEGGMVLPAGYLPAAYAAVRAHGGVAIADEVQVGFGRLGAYLWGFQEQGVVPDIVTLAKAMGNGQPLGAVVTTRAIADSFNRAGTFFSSTGGSPVSCVVGSTVLDIWGSERLQDNALIVGRHLRSRLEQLAQQLASGELPAAAAYGLSIGALHGMGLYQGVEFVKDGTEPAGDATLGLCDRMLDLGVIMQPTGEHFNILKIKPPMCLTPESADHVVDALTHALSTGW